MGRQKLRVPVDQLFQREVDPPKDLRESTIVSEGRKLMNKQQRNNTSIQKEVKCYLCGENSRRMEVSCFEGLTIIGTCDYCQQICCEQCITLRHFCANVEHNGIYCLKCAPEMAEVSCPYGECNNNRYKTNEREED